MSVSRVVLAAVVVAAAVTAAVLLNLALLSGASAQNDPVGTLSPRAKLPPAPSWTIRPAHGPHEGESKADD
jgi:hypothetical protein